MTAEKKSRIKQSPRQGREETLASQTHEKLKKDHAMKPFGRIVNQGSCSACVKTPLQRSNGTKHGSERRFSA
jgi:hypothetical protein